MSFTRAFATTMQREGGYINNPKDSGGETYMGIARNHHPWWEGWTIIDELIAHQEPLSLSVELSQLVRDFYRSEFWDRLKCGLIDPVSEAVAEELFEASVNCGRSNGVKFLQRALNTLNSNGKLFADLTVDGGIGQQTIAATLTMLTHRPPRLLVKCQNGEQYIHYKNWARHEDFPGVFERTGA